MTRSSPPSPPPPPDTTPDVAPSTEERIQTRSQARVSSSSPLVPQEPNFTKGGGQRLASPTDHLDDGPEDLDDDDELPELVPPLELGNDAGLHNPSFPQLATEVEMSTTSEEHLQAGVIRAAFENGEELLNDLLSSLGEFPGTHNIYLECRYGSFMTALANFLQDHGSEELPFQSLYIIFTALNALAKETDTIRVDSKGSLDSIRTDLLREQSDREKRFADTDKQFKGLVTRRQLEAVQEICEKEIRKVARAVLQRCDNVEDMVLKDQPAIAELQQQLNVTLNRLESLERTNAPIDNQVPVPVSVPHNTTPQVTPPDDDDRIILPGSLSDPSFFRSLIHLLDDIAPGEDERAFKQRNEAGIRQLFDASRATVSNSAQRLYNIFATAFKLRSAEESSSLGIPRIIPRHLPRPPRHHPEEFRDSVVPQDPHEPPPVANIPPIHVTASPSPPTPLQPSHFPAHSVQTPRPFLTPGNPDQHRFQSPSSSINHQELSRTQLSHLERMEIMIDKIVGRDPATNHSQVKMRAPEPPKYGGVDDPEVLDRWVYTLLKYLRSVEATGPVHDQLRVEMTGSYLEGEASDWFKEEVEGPTRLVEEWTFKDMLFGLARRFISESSAIEAEHKFDNLCYDPKTGARYFHGELKRLASCMADCPSDYAMSRKFILGLPPRMRDDLVERQGYRPTTNVLELVSAACRIENGRLFNQRLVAAHNSPIDRSHASSSLRPSNRITNQGPRSRDRTFPSNSNRPRESPTASTSAPARNARVNNNNRDRSRDTCNSCGQQGHWRNDPICPNFKTARAHQARMEGSTAVERIEEEVTNDDDPIDGDQYEYRKEIPSHDEEYGEPSEPEEATMESCVRFEEQYDDDEFVPEASVRGMRIRSLTPVTAQLNRLGNRQTDEPKANRKEPLHGGQIRPKPGQKMQPERTALRQHCLTALLHVNGLEVYTLFDSGSSLDVICSDFARSANIPTFRLEEALEVQLGMKGSHSRVTAGARVDISTPEVSFPRRFVDISNIDKYQMILGTPFFRDYNVILDFGASTVTMGRTVIKCLPIAEDLALSSPPPPVRNRRPKDKSTTEGLPHAIRTMDATPSNH